MPLVRPFTAVPALLKRLRAAGLKVAVASSAKQTELDQYLEVAGITDLVDATTCSDDVSGSKPDPDIFLAALKKLGVEASEAVAIGDTPYDGISATKAGLTVIGVLSGGFREEDLREAGCVDSLSRNRRAVHLLRQLSLGCLASYPPSIERAGRMKPRHSPKPIGAAPSRWARARRQISSPSSRKRRTSPEGNVIG